MMRVLGRSTSINVRKVLWTAAETGVSFVHENEWALSKDTRSPEFQAFNPNGLVPVLICEDGTLWESNTICRYLAAKSERTDLLPDTPFARANVEKWMDWQAADLNGACQAAFLGLVRQNPVYKDDHVAIARSTERWNALMLVLESHMAEGGSYVLGECFTLADVVLGLSLQRWLLTPILRPSTPALAAYRQRLLSRPTVKAWIPADIP
ncbi:MAG: glutathione S-transferase family protein [Methylobacterium sp.]|uniref:glutathione S-transferase family protein n=1 Tax=Methylobacterium sp. TaxID=409 RepID=UPI0025F8AEA3|nr:glutathione S-transferase family protein [Methylobacterium sp.]MBX9932287.1 glutathione S-transferase family protein [Methylobacterium sp.]